MPYDPSALVPRQFDAVEQWHLRGKLRSYCRLWLVSLQLDVLAFISDYIKLILLRRTYAWTE